MPHQMNSSDYTPQQLTGHRMLRGILIALTVITLLNLLLAASLAGLIGGILLLIMVWGIHKETTDCEGAGGVSFVYAAVDLIVLLLSALFSSTARVLSMVWLGIYSLGLLICGLLLRRSEIRAWLEIAPQPTGKEKKIHFFHGGWRDL